MIKYTFAVWALWSLAVAQNTESIQSQIDAAISKTQVLQLKLDETVTLAEEIRQTLAAINTGSAMSFRYIEGFEGNDLGDWEKSSPSSTFAAVATEQRSGSYCLRGGTDVAGNDTTLVLYLSMSAEGSLTFWVKGDAYSDIRVGVRDTSGVFSWIWQGSGASAGGTPDDTITASYQQVTITIPSDTAIVFIEENYNASGSTFHIDDIQLTNVAGLTVDQDVTATSVTPTHALLGTGVYTANAGAVGRYTSQYAFAWFVFETGRSPDDVITSAFLRGYVSRSVAGSVLTGMHTKLYAAADPPANLTDFNTKYPANASATVEWTVANNGGVYTLTQSPQIESIVNAIPDDEPTWNGDVELWLRNVASLATNDHYLIKTAEDATQKPVLRLTYYQALTHSADAGTFDTNTIALTGTHDTFADITVEFNGQSYTSADEELVDDGDGTWTLTVPAPTTPDDYELNVRVGSLYAPTATITSEYAPSAAIPGNPSYLVGSSLLGKLHNGASLLP